MITTATCPTRWPAWFERPMLINMEQSCGLSRPCNDRVVLNFGDFNATFS